MSIEVVLVVAIVAAAVVLVTFIVRRKPSMETGSTVGALDPEVFLAPVREQIESLASRINGLSDATAEARIDIKNKIDAAIRETQEVYQLSDDLRQTTTKISTALQGTGQRGNWGELQLRRVVELAGLTKHVTFKEQVTSRTDEGKEQTPDMIVYFPDDRVIAVDSKAPDLNLDGGESRSAAALKAHIDTLAKKNYQKSIKNSMEFMVCFVPSEGTLASALTENENLMEYAFSQKVLLATPMSLLGLLKAVEYGWKQLEQIENVAIINKNAFELSDRALILLAHFKDLGDSLSSAMVKYNDAVRSANSRLIPEIINMKKLGVDIRKSTDELPETVPVPENLREFPALKPN